MGAGARVRVRFTAARRRGCSGARVAAALARTHARLERPSPMAVGVPHSVPAPSCGQPSIDQ